MSDPWMYLNGAFVTRRDARIPIEERGYLFGEGVYEVTRYYNGRPLAMDAHMQRLQRSMQAIGITPNAHVHALPWISDELLTRNDLRDALVYWQVTRGAMPRVFTYDPDLPPTVLAVTYPAEPGRSEPGRLRAILTEDRRWRDVWIKTTMLLPNIMAYNAAKQAGCDAAIMHRAGRITEATSANLFCVHDGRITTPADDGAILRGITRQVVLQLIAEHHLPVAEAAVDTSQLLAADEVFLTGTTTEIAAVVAIDGQTIGKGEPGPVTRQLVAAFALRAAAGEAG